MSKILVERKDAKELADSLDSKFKEVYDELTNNQKFKTGYLAANLIELDKTELNAKIVAIIEVLKEIKSLKEFKPKRRP